MMKSLRPVESSLRAVLACACIVPATSLTAMPPCRDSLYVTVVDVATLPLQSKRGRVQVDVYRPAATGRDAEALAVAESAPVSIDVIEEYEDLMGVERDGVCVPAGVTSGAVAYFLGLADLVERGVFKTSSGATPSSARLEYSAKVEYFETFQNWTVTFSNVRVVRMELSWELRMECSGFMRISGSRMVIVDEDGQIVALEGDGNIEVLMQ